MKIRLHPDYQARLETAVINMLQATAGWLTTTNLTSRLGPMLGPRTYIETVTCHHTDAGGFARVTCDHTHTHVVTYPWAKVNNIEVTTILRRLERENKVERQRPAGHPNQPHWWRWNTWQPLVQLIREAQ